MTTYVITASYLHGHTVKRYAECDRARATFAIYESFLHAGIELTKENFSKIFYSLEDNIDSINFELSDYTKMNCNNIDYILCNMTHSNTAFYYALLSDINYQPIVFDKMENAVATIYNHLIPYTGIDSDILYKCIYDCLEEAKCHYSKYVILRTHSHIGATVVCEFPPRYWDCDVSVKITFYREFEFCDTDILDEMINFAQTNVKPDYIKMIDDMKTAFTKGGKCRYLCPNHTIYHNYDVVGFINDGRNVKIYDIPSEIGDSLYTVMTN